MIYIYIYILDKKIVVDIYIYIKYISIYSSKRFVVS